MSKVLIDREASGVVGPGSKDALPPILVGRQTVSVKRQVRSFYLSVAEMLERWLARCQSPHTQRAYRQDVMTFVRFMKFSWPEDASRLLLVRVSDVQRYRDFLLHEQAAPKSIVRRISSLSGFYRFIREIAADYRLPVIIPNPAHSQFLPRGAADAVEETRSLTLAKARRLLTLPAGDSLLSLRDRAILAFYLYSGARIATGCRLEVKDFRFDEHDPKIRICEKGSRRRTIGLHFEAAHALRDYIEMVELRSGSLFRTRLNSRSPFLGERGFSTVSMWRRRKPGNALQQQS